MVFPAFLVIEILLFDHIAAFPVTPAPPPKNNFISNLPYNHFESGSQPLAYRIEAEAD